MPSSPHHVRSGLLAAYLAAPAAARVAGVIQRRKRVAERIATALGGRVSCRDVDYRRHGNQRIGCAVLASLSDLRRGDTLLVDEVQELGIDRGAFVRESGSRPPKAGPLR